MKRRCSFLLLLFTAHQLFAQPKAPSTDSIAQYFQEVKVATKNSVGLWQKDLYGAILLVNPETREVYANQPDSLGILIKKGSVYYGNLPNSINIANTAMSWSGTDWAMILLPLPSDKFDRINLLSHELFHRAQSSLGFKLFNPDNNHLDEKDGRTYLRLELQALKKALLASSAAEVKMRIADALTFRRYRHLLYTGADSTENRLELNEGLAEYYGLITSARNKKQALLHLSDGMNEFLQNPTYVRSFAYQTIPIYGYLLRQMNAYWNRDITINTNLTDYFIKAFKIRTTDNLKVAIARLNSIYNAPSVIAEETSREEKRKALVLEYARKYTESPHFEIQFEQMNVSYDPRNIIPVLDKGTYYPNIRVSDKWGILTVTDGGLMSPNWDKIYITVPTTNNGKEASGEGWSLTLNESYKLIKDVDDNYRLRK